MGLQLRRDRKRTDLVHVHYGMFAPIGLVSGSPFVLHFHGGDLLEDHAQIHWRMLHTYAARRAALCLVSTPDLLRYSHRLGVPLEFLPNPVEEDVPHDGRGGGILFASKLDARKGSEIFLPAAVDLRMRGHKVTVLGFGSHTRESAATVDHLRRVGAEIIDERLSRDAFNRLVGNADVVVGQFSVGALGMTELDALMRGRPVITRFDFSDAYRCPPPIVAAHNKQEIVDKVEWLLLNDEARRARSTEGRAWVQQEHGTTKIIRRLVGIYERALRAHCG